jgi:hypothetical protein
VGGSGHWRPEPSTDPAEKVTVVVALGGVKSFLAALLLSDFSRRCTIECCLFPNCSGYFSLSRLTIASAVSCGSAASQFSIIATCGSSSTPAGKRAGIFKSFQDESDPLRAIVADPGTMAHGLDLFAADVVIWYGTTDKPELYQQANKRAHRPGQKWPVTVVQLAATALEREIFNRLESREDLQSAMLDIIARGEFI